ncbi:MATE family efflux transporter [Xenorhabdus bovienii]|uniref:Na+ driven multidrug efflux pump n=1 Tax=Xenorhabdus bovienii str. feltiae Moldova TaxID=1398200 RepID=A0A077NUR2_XENBV|nr:MATE family efflux transporter [Xenorhabdus bovienii]CDH01341.1 membrane hypothetical protein [Xenorhabdus bovienii str. feltiae Moldova]
MDNKPSVLPFSIWSLAIPIFIDMLLSFSIFFVDSLFLSHISTAMAASVGTIIPIFVIFVLLFMMMAQGAINVGGQIIGYGKLEKLNLNWSGILIINAFLGGIVFLVLFFGSFPLAKVMGLKNNEVLFASEYLKYISIALWLMAIKFSLSTICMAQGKTQYNLYAGIIANGLNIVLNLIFVIYFEQGLMGVIFATIISQMIVCLYYFLLVTQKLQARFPLKSLFAQPAAILKPILAIGVPAAVQPITVEAGMLVLSIFTISLGETAMAARIFVMNLLTLTICWSSAMSIANQIMISHLYGAKQYDLINQQVNRNLRLAMLGSLLAIVLILLCGKSLLGLFTSNVDIINTGMVLLVLCVAIEPFRSAAMVISYSLKATGDATFPAWVAVGSTWCIAVPLGYFLGINLSLGIAGLWIGLLCDEVFRSAVNNARWLSGKWKASHLKYLETE